MMDTNISKLRELSDPELYQQVCDDAHWMAGKTPIDDDWEWDEAEWQIHAPRLAHAVLEWYRREDERCIKGGN